MDKKRLGILGGGQLGLLLNQAAMRFPIEVSIYDPNPECSAAQFTNNFVEGSFDDFEKLLEFGLKQDTVIFEIEKINIKALLELEKKGVNVVSSPQTLEWIQDKGVQKSKLEAENIPTSRFQFVPAGEVKSYTGPFPIVQKWRTGGYDGSGVCILKDQTDLTKVEAVDSIFEEKVEIAKEIGLLVARNKQGEIVIYPPVEMVFDPVANLVDHLIAPAQIDQNQIEKILYIAKKMAEKLNFIGLYAIEFFINKSGEVFVNEISPRTHNSGHHTISGNITSQYEQQIRIALDLPLGAPTQIKSCIMLNLLAENKTGRTYYQGLAKAFAIENVQYTFYGKKEVKPGRKMGHALILEKGLEKGLKTMEDIRKTLKITAQ